MRMYLLTALMLASACVTETSIIKNNTKDTEEIVIDTTDGDSNRDTEVLNPGVNDNITGLIEMGLRQVACPACVGVSEELTLILNISDG